MKLLLQAFGVALLTLAPAAAAQSVDTPDRIISDRSAKPQPPPAHIVPRNQSVVQIHGPWVEDLSQCKTATNDARGGGVFLTDTLLRWGRNTCSIRDVSKTANGALVNAMCVSDQGDRKTTFTLARKAPDRMQIMAANGTDKVSLVRCP